MSVVSSSQKTGGVAVGLGVGDGLRNMELVMGAPDKELVWAVVKLV